MSQIPLLIVSDSPTGPSGLGRITRELAIRIDKDLKDVFRVGTLGYGEPRSRYLPFEQYPIRHIDNFIIPELPGVWKDFAGDEEGIIMTIWNPGWLWWFSNPDKIGDGELKDFLKRKPFKSWGYFPIDAEGPNWKMIQSEANTIKGFDRILAYTKWAANNIDRALGNIGCDEPVTEYLPHGTDTAVFYPRDKKEARATFLKRMLNKDAVLKDDTFLIGIAATNTPRKDWGLGFEVCHELLQRGVNVGLWAHTDALQKGGSWNLLTLADEFEMNERTIFTNDHYSDDTMAWAYNAMDVTLGIGSGEGWGMPLSESLACNVPVIHGNYAGGAEIVPEEFRIDPIGFRIDGFFGARRPVFKASDWADKVIAAKDVPCGLERKYWWHGRNGAWQQWKKWLCDGV